VTVSTVLDEVATADLSRTIVLDALAVNTITIDLEEEDSSPVDEEDRKKLLLGMTPPLPMLTVPQKTLTAPPLMMPTVLPLKDPLTMTTRPAETLLPMPTAPLLRTPMVLPLTMPMALLPKNLTAPLPTMPMALLLKDQPTTITKAPFP